MSFDLDFTKKGDFKNHVRKFFLYPERWNSPATDFPLPLKWKGYKFTESNRSKIPKEKGIYCFVLKPNLSHFIETTYLFYAGKTNRTLRERYKEYLNDQEGKGKPRVKVYEMLSLYSEDIYFYFSPIEGKSDVDVCEEILINTFVPHINCSIPEAKINNELKYIYE